MKRLIWLFVLLFLLLVIWLLFIRGTDERREPIVLRTPAGLETTEFQMLDTVVFDAVDLEPLASYTVRILDDDDGLVSELRLTADPQGRIPAAALWYDIGIGPCREVVIPAAASTDLGQLNSEDSATLGQRYRLHLLQADRLVREVEFNVTEALVRPALYASDARGCPQAGFLIGEEDVWVVGENFPSGSLIRLWAVPASTDWQPGDPLEDRTKQYLGQIPPIFELRDEATRFQWRLWPRHLTSLGSYDIVAEVVTYPFGTYQPTATAEAFNAVSTLAHSGFVVQRRPGAAEPLEMELAGSVSSPLTYRETFLTHETVWVGVDPTVQPSHIGQSADIYIVADRPAAQWLAGTTLNDVTPGPPETITVQFVCGNCWSTPAWYPPLTPGEYDVVLDFNQNGVYDPGVDLIDSEDPVGFTVSEIRVKTVSFNYAGSGAITIQDGSGDVTPPEYAAGATSVKPAAWVQGTSQSVQVDFEAKAGVTSAEIWALGGLGGLASSSSPVTVSFPGGTGQGTFAVNTVPTSAGKHAFYWTWKYKDSAGTHSMGRTGEHLLYSTLGSPVAPHSKPPLHILDYSSTWASGATSDAQVCSEMLVNGFQGHYTWNFDCHRLAGDFVRLLAVQGVPGAQHRWASLGCGSTSSLNDMCYQRTIPFDAVGPTHGHMAQDWSWHHWAEAVGAQRDAAAGASLAGTWGDYEDHLFDEYQCLKDLGPPIQKNWIANQADHGTGCEAPGHRTYSSLPPFSSWRGPDR